MRARPIGLLSTLPVLLALVIGLSVSRGPVAAEQPLDFDVAGGHYFSQGSIDEAPDGMLGFTITDDEGIAFWSTFRRLGGQRVLGYPISGRFIWGGVVCQLVQKGMLQWNPVTQQATLANLTDLLSAAGYDDWLESTKQVPKPAAIAYPEGASWGQVAQAHYRLLDGSRDIKSEYSSSAIKQEMLGLPQSAVQDFGKAIAVRFQRGVMYLDKADYGTGSVWLGKIGEFARESGILGPEPFVPIAAADYAAVLPVIPLEVLAAQADPSAKAEGRIVEGLATYYADYFHGRVMRNGEIFDMYNPTTTACNIFPLGSWLKVTSKVNGRSVIVRVTDTGAFKSPLIVDLSWAAFVQLGREGEGVHPVTVELLR